MDNFQFGFVVAIVIFLLYCLENKIICLNFIPALAGNEIRFEKER